MKKNIAMMTTRSNTYTVGVDNTIAVSPLVKSGDSINMIATCKHTGRKFEVSAQVSAILKG